MACVLLTTLAIGAANISLTILPAMFAVVIGVGYFIHSVIDHRFLFKLTAYGWWAACVALSLQTSVNNFAWFALAILLLQTAPTTWLHINGRSKG